MAIYTGVGGSAKSVSKIYTGIDGVARPVYKGYIGVDGVAKNSMTAAIPSAPLHWEQNLALQTRAAIPAGIR